jgi:peptidyl-prolyl cis-trans isomerase D
MLMHKLREGAGGWVTKILLGMLVVAFVIWGIADVFRGWGAQDVAVVGSNRIGVEEFRRIYTDRLQTLSRQLGRGFTSEQARALGLDRQILGEMIAEAAFDAKARDLRLNVDDKALAQRIQSNPAFRGPAGTFDPGYYRQILQQNGFTEQRFETSERKLMLRQQIAQALGGEIAAPAVLLDAVRRYELEERSVQYVALTRADAGEIPAPTPEQLTAFYDARKATFRAPEYRKISYIALTPETLVPWIQISEEDVKKAYELRKERISTPERRLVEQIVFPNLEEARAAAERLRQGTKFEDLVAERKLDPKDVAIGLVTRREILDPAVANAAFSLAVGATSEPVAGRFGAVIVRVLKIEPGHEPALAEVADALRRELAIERARTQLLELHDKIEDERASGSTILETAKKLALNAAVIEAVDRSGRERDGAQVQNVPGLEQLLAGAFATKVGVEADAIELRAPGGVQGYVWYEVLEITPSRDRTLEEAKALVEARWRDEEIGKRLAERAEAIRAKLDAGEAFAAAAPGLKVVTAEKLRRGRSAAGLDARTIARIFETPQGKAAIATAEDGISRVVFRVSAIISPPPDAKASQTDALVRGLEDDLVTQYLLRLQNDLGVRINEAALRQVTGGEAN